MLLESSRYFVFIIPILIIPIQGSQSKTTEKLCRANTKAPKRQFLRSSIMNLCQRKASFWVYFWGMKNPHLHSLGALEFFKFCRFWGSWEPKNRLLLKSHSFIFKMRCQIYKPWIHMKGELLTNLCKLERWKCIETAFR